MGIMVTKDENNSELDRRISADLRTRAQARRNDPDYVEDAAYMKDLKKTGKFSWIWIVLVILAAISLICIVFI